LAISSINYEEGFQHFSCSDMFDHSCTINIWDRQWSQDLQDLVLDWAVKCRVANQCRLANPSEPATRTKPGTGMVVAQHASRDQSSSSDAGPKPKWQEVQDAIRLQQHALEQVFGLPWAHDILAKAFQLMSKHIVKAIIADQGASLAVVTPGDGGRPGKMQGPTGPWHGPNISVSQWAAELIHTVAKRQSITAEAGLCGPYDTLEPKANGPEPHCLKQWQQKQAEGLALGAAPWLDAVLTHDRDAANPVPFLQDVRTRAFLQLSKEIQRQIQIIESDH
jgi:hypothetical protein